VRLRALHLAIEPQQLGLAPIFCRGGRFAARRPRPAVDLYRRIVQPKGVLELTGRHQHRLDRVVDAGANFVDGLQIHRILHREEERAVRTLTLYGER